MTTIAITREVPESIAHCELTHLQREPIDVARAREQHAIYERTLRDLGCELVHAPRLDAHPDSVFVEDTVIVLDDVAVLTRPGAESRRGEVDSMANVLENYRELARIEAPGTVDGGDVLRIGNRLYVGLSTRTNDAAIEQLRRFIDVTAIAIDDCLHLKSAVTAIDGCIVFNPAWIDRAHFGGLDAIEVDPSEPYAANVIQLGDVVLCASAFPRTRERIEEHGFQTRAVDASELAKAEGALTCCSVIFPIP